MAAVESARPETVDLRNRLVRDWFREALKEEPAFVKPGRKKKLTRRVK